MMSCPFLLLLLLHATTLDLAVSFVGNSPAESFQRIQDTHLKSSFSDWSSRTGDSALRQVQFLASKVAESTAAGEKAGKVVGKSGPKSVRGTGGVVYNNPEFNRGVLLDNEKSDGDFILNPNLEIRVNSKREEQVWTALANLELDMQLLDKVAGQKPQLTALELTLLSASVAAAASGPWLVGGKLTEFLAPTAAAFCAAIGIGAEYVGRVSVADGKEVAAASIQCAAEAEGLLANSERSKAIMPLCVGVGATATTFSLLVPVLLGSLNPNIFLLNEIYLVCPLISVLSAAVGSLALQESRSFAARATSVGNRRFARSGLVGRTWLSSAEQIIGKSEGARQKWRTFCFSVLPAPIIGSLVPGTSLATKSIIITALAAAQSAYFLAQSEYSLARATDAVAVKARSAAVCDTYANQGARSAAILPFTSALSGLCAAATAAIVELPFLESLSAAGTFAGLSAEMAIVAFFPAFSALFAAAASVSKARCEVQAEAAVQAASTLALEYNADEEDDPILRPFRGVAELIQLTYSSSVVEPLLRFLGRLKRTLRVRSMLRKLFRRNSSRSDKPEAAPAI